MLQLRGIQVSWYIKSNSAAIKCSEMHSSHSKITWKLIVFHNRVDQIHLWFVNRYFKLTSTISPRSATYSFSVSINSFKTYLQKKGGQLHWFHQVIQYINNIWQLKHVLWVIQGVILAEFWLAQHINNLGAICGPDEGPLYWNVWIFLYWKIQCMMVAVFWNTVAGF